MKRLGFSYSALYVQVAAPGISRFSDTCGGRVISKWTIERHSRQLAEFGILGGHTYVFKRSCFGFLTVLIDISCALAPFELELFDVVDCCCLLLFCIVAVSGAHA